MDKRSLDSLIYGGHGLQVIFWLLAFHVVISVFFHPTFHAKSQKAKFRQFQWVFLQILVDFQSMLIDFLSFSISFSQLQSVLISLISFNQFDPIENAGIY